MVINFIRRLFLQKKESQLTGELDALYSAEKWDELLGKLDVVATLELGSRKALYYKGVALARLARYEEALCELDDLEAVSPEYPQLSQVKGHIYLAKQQHALAISTYGKAIQLDDEDIVSWVNLGRAFFEVKQVLRATRAFLRALDVDSECKEAKLYLAKVYSFEKKYDVAEELLLGLYDKHTDIEIVQTIVDVWVDQGEYSKSLKFVEDAKKHFSRHIVDSARLESIKGFVLQSQGKLDQALQSFLSSLEQDDCIFQTHFNLGLLLLDLGRRSDAKSQFQRALEISPVNLPVKWQLSLFDLAAGDYKAGWIGYELRFMSEDGMQREFNLQRWAGQKVNSGELLIVAEQGLGDEIMFGSCLPDLLLEVPGSMIECNVKLAELYKRSFPSACVIGGNQAYENQWIESYPSIKYFFPVGSLPSRYRQHRKDFPSAVKYLEADDNKRRLWARKLGSLAGLKVGISWQGGLPSTRSGIRSIPLMKMCSFLYAEGMEFVSLQYTSCEKEIAEVQETLGIKVHHWRDVIDDYDETAALLESLDIVVSVQTAIVHLAGALSVKTYALIPAAPEWRYMAEGEKMPWYSNVTLFRQDKLHEWDDTLISVAENIKVFAQNRSKHESLLGKE